MSVKEYEKGDTARFESTITDSDGAIVSPDQKDGSYQISINIKDSDADSIVLTNTRMSSISSTQFAYNWATDESMNDGEYEVEIRATVSNEQVLNRDRIKLVDII